MKDRVIAIGDVHASDYWREIVKLRRQGDKIVFLGDYFDRRGCRGTSIARNEAENFAQICQYAREHENVTLLVGNHDFQYLPWDENVTSAVNNAMYATFRGLLLKNLDLLEMVGIHEAGGRRILFSHAGVTQTFLDLCDCSFPQDLNRVWRENPEKFSFSIYAPQGFENLRVELHGDNIFQPPTWIRPDALKKDAVPGYDQVVGHTFNPEPRKAFAMQNGHELHIVCTFGPDNYLVCGDNT